MKINLEKIKDLLKNKSFLKRILDFSARQGQWMLFLFFLALLGYCGYLWKMYVSDYSWSEEKKLEYIKSKGSEVFLDENKFEKIFQESEARKIEYEKTVENISDIFRLK